MNRSQKTILLMFVFLLVISLPSFAQQALKIALVNSQRSFEQSIEGKRAIAQLQDRENKIKNDLQKMDDSIRALESKLSTGRLTMTPEALMALQADLDKKNTERKRYEEDAGKEINQMQINLVTRIRDEMIKVINELRTERGFDLVLDLVESGAIAWNSAIDITDEVIRRYDATKAAPVKK